MVNVCQNNDGSGVVGSISVGSLYTDGKTAGNNEVTINKGSWSSGQISFTKSKGTASTKTVQLTAATTTWDGNTASRVIWDGTAADSQHGVSTGYTVTVDASGRYTAGETAGKNAVTITKGTWSNGIIQFTKSEGTASTKTVQLTKDTATWNNNTASVKIYDGTSVQQGSYTGYTVTVDASGRYTAGQNSVNVTKTAWTTALGSGRASITYKPDSGTESSSRNQRLQITLGYDYINGQNSVIALASENGSTFFNIVSRPITMSEGGWSNGENKVTTYIGSGELSSCIVYAPAVKVAGNWNNGILTVSSNSSGTSLPKTFQLTAASATWSGNTASVKIYDGTSVQYGTDTGYTVTVDASGRYTAGQNSVNVSKGIWSSGVVSLSTSAGTGSGAEVRLTAASATWSDNTASVKIYDGTSVQAGTYTGYTVTVDASGRYTAGQNSVNVSKGYWSGGQISFSTSSGTGSGSGAKVSLGGSWAQDGSACKYNYTIYDSWSGTAGSTGYTGSITANPWINPADHEVNHQGYLAYDTLYGITLAGYTLATWRTPAQGGSSHSVSLTVDLGWTGSISGYTNMGSKSASSLARTYIRVAASCGNSSVKRYWTIN